MLCRSVPVILLLVVFCYSISGASYRKELNPIPTDDNFYQHPISENILCEQLDPVILESLLGPAFNPRYMSVEKPGSRLPSTLNNDSQKRKTNPKSESFSVNENFYKVIENVPAWELTSHVIYSELEKPYSQVNKREAGRCGGDEIDESKVSKRDVNLIQEWQCKSKIIWTDLGPDYFPRYLRSVECLKKNCWYDLYQCTPRSFTVKLLKRRKGKCVKVDKAVRKMGLFGLPSELKELWVWEERAVVFCCDCSRNKALF